MAQQAFVQAPEVGRHLTSLGHVPVSDLRGGHAACSLMDRSRLSPTGR